MKKQENEIKRLKVAVQTALMRSEVYSGYNAQVVLEILGREAPQYDWNLYIFNGGMRIQGIIKEGLVSPLEEVYFLRPWGGVLEEEF